LLLADDLRSGYRGTPVLLGASLRLDRGEIAAVLGRNGVGKSTLLRCLIGLLPVQSGRLLFEDKDITNVAGHRRAALGIAYVPQGREIFPRLSVLDNIRVGAIAAGRDPKVQVEEVLTEFPMLGKRLRNRGETLSGGEQQQLALGRALASGPKVLLLDEPSEGIQPSVVAEIALKIRALAERRGISVLLVEQNLDFAASVASRAYVMRKGQMVQELATNDIVNSVDIQQEYIGV